MELPSYYANVPFYVRYDRDLSPMARMMFGEITALSSSEGYCWASNKYFAELYGVSPSTISGWISELAEKKYVFLEITDRHDRKIYIQDPKLLDLYMGYQKKPKGVSEKAEGGVSEKAEENNTSINNKINMPSASFEDWMQDQGYRRDSIVDSDGNTAIWWEDDNGRRLKTPEEKSLRAKWKREVGFDRPKAIPTSADDTNQLCDLIKSALSKQYGNAPVVSSEDKTILRKNLVEKYPAEFIRNYAQWYFVDSTIEKKWRFNITAFASTKFINSFLAETEYQLWTSRT